MLLAGNAVAQVVKIFDEYLDMISLEPTLFTLNIKNSFEAYNNPAHTELQIRSFMNRVAMGLLSAIRIMGIIPIIRAPTGGAAEMLARDFSSLLHENLTPRGAAYQLLSGALITDRPRPLMLIFDRTCDLSTSAMHTSTYQSLIDDLLDHKLNRVTIESSKGSAEKKKTYDLNTQNDLFFSKYAGTCSLSLDYSLYSKYSLGAPFPAAVEANEKELSEISAKEAEIRSRPGEALTGDIDSREKELNSAIESLPELLARKANLEAHTNILQATMKHIAAREVPTYFDIEQSILSAGRVNDKAAVLGLLRDGSKGTLLDKARLLVVVAALASSERAEDYDAAFTAGCTAMNPAATPKQIEEALNAVKFIRRLIALQNPISQRLSAMKSSQIHVGLSSIISSAHLGASSLMAKAALLFAKFTPFYITRVVDNLAEGRPCTEDDSFCTIDPRSPDSIPEKGVRYSEVIVFVLGGGTYGEYDNLQELLKQKASGGALRSIAYGCSELTSGDEFFNQLIGLGNAG